MPREPNKRERLLSAANNSFIQIGTNNTTFSIIAEKADVPSGNVYYYFKNKEAMIDGVIEEKNKDVDELLEQINNSHQAPKDRLQAFIKAFFDKSENSKQLGASITFLNYELTMDGGENYNKIDELTKTLINWCAKQFETLGKGDFSNQFAINLLISLQGTCVMERRTNNENLIVEQTNFIGQTFV